jgi:hypothetical protein
LTSLIFIASISKNKSRCPQPIQNGTEQGST